MANTRLEKFFEATLQAIVYGIYVYHKKKTKTFRDFLISVKKGTAHMPTETYNVVKHYPVNNLSESDKIYLVGNVSRMLPLLSEEDRNNKKIAISAITSYVGEYKNISKELKSDVDVLYLTIMKSERKRFFPWNSEEKSDFFSDVDVRVFDDENFLSLCLEKNQYFIEVLPEEFYKDKNRVLGILKKLQKDNDKNIIEIAGLMLKRLPEDLIMDFNFLEEYIALAKSFKDDNGDFFNADLFLKKMDVNYFLKPGVFEYWGDRLSTVLKLDGLYRRDGYDLLKNKEFVNLVLNKDVEMIRLVSFPALRDFAFEKIELLENVELKKQIVKEYFFQALLKGNGFERLNKEEVYSLINEERFEKDFTEYQKKNVGMFETKDLGACFSSKMNLSVPQGYGEFLDFFKDVMYAKGINKVNFLFRLDSFRYGESTLDENPEILGWSGLLQQADKNGVNMDFRKEIISSLFMSMEEALKDVTQRSVFTPFFYDASQIEAAMREKRMSFINVLLTKNMDGQEKRDLCDYVKDKLYESGEKQEDVKVAFLKIEIDLVSNDDMWNDWKNEVKKSESKINGTYRNELEKRKVLGKYLSSLNVNNQEDVVFLEKEFRNIPNKYIKYIPSSFKDSDYLFKKIIVKGDLKYRQAELGFFIDKVLKDKDILLSVSELENYKDIEKLLSSALKERKNDKDFWLNFLSASSLYKAENAIPKQWRNKEFITELLNVDFSRKTYVWHNLIENKWLDKEEIRSLWLNNSQSYLGKLTKMNEEFYAVANIFKTYPDDPEIMKNFLENMQEKKRNTDFFELDYIFQMVVRNMGPKILKNDEDFFNILELLEPFKVYKDKDGCQGLQILMGNETFAELFEKRYGEVSMMEVFNEDKEVMKKILIKYNERNMRKDLEEKDLVVNHQVKKLSKF